MFKRFMYMLAAASFIFGGVAAKAQDAGALLDLLVRKKNHYRPGSGRSSRRPDERSGNDFGGQMEIVHANHRARTLR